MEQKLREPTSISSLHCVAQRETQYRPAKNPCIDSHSDILCNIYHSKTQNVIFNSFSSALKQHCTEQSYNMKTSHHLIQEYTWNIFFTINCLLFSVFWTWTKLSSQLECSKVYTAAPQGQERRSFNYCPITHHN